MRVSSSGNIVHCFIWKSKVLPHNEQTQHRAELQQMVLQLSDE